MLCLVINADSLNKMEELYKKIKLYSYFLYFLHSLKSVSSGWSAGTDKKYLSIALARKHPWAYYQGGKVHWCLYILIFHGHNQYKWFAKLTFHLTSNPLKTRNIWKIHKKSCLLSFLVILSLGLRIEHF
jgi:hypothetical protein